MAASWISTSRPAAASLSCSTNQARTNRSGPLIFRDATHRTVTSVNHDAADGNLNQLPAVLILLAGLALASLCYSEGLGGSLHFDDPHNLGGLTQVVDKATAIAFIAQGDAGPLGRPLALASFVPQAYAWPNSPATFLYVNVCLHLLNGMLVAWLLYLLCMTRSNTTSQAAWIAAVSASIWLVLPLLASSSLLVVQRMTTLSATFVLLGFVAYIYSRSMLERYPRLALLMMSTSVAVGTALAAFTKENGALLPVLILAAEATLLPRPARSGVTFTFATWRNVVLLAPTIALAGYLTFRGVYSDSTLLMRNFNAGERLLTEARILWEYLTRAFLPMTSTLGPFHDDHWLYRNWLQPLSLLAVLAWLAVVSAAVAYRKRAPLFAFAVFWYLAGHSLESTTIPLELYFEHRNYVPLIGPVFALVASITTTALPHLIARGGLLAYLIVLSAVLFNTTSLWGRPALAAEMWAIYKPESQRAVQYLAQQLELAGDTYTARRVLESYLAEKPERVGVALQVLALSCVLEPHQPQRELLDVVETGLPTADFEHGIVETLARIYRMAADEQCPALDRKDVYRFAELTAGNPAFSAVSVAHHNLHVLMSEEAFENRDLSLTMHHIEAALSSHYTVTTLQLAVHMLNSAGLHNLAKEFLQQASSREPLHPLRAAAWSRNIAALEKATNESLTP